MKIEQSAILVIDDEDEVRTSIVNLLRNTGFTVVEAPNGRRGMEQLSQHYVTLVLTDILMPEMDGLEVVMEIRRSHPTKKIVAMSKGLDLLRLAKALGAHATVAKPFEARDLLDTISRVSQNQQLSLSGNGHCHSGEARQDVGSDSDSFSSPDRGQALPR